MVFFTNYFNTAELNVEIFWIHQQFMGLTLVGCRQCLLPNQRDALPGSMTFKFYLSCGRRFRLITDRNHSITIPIASRYVPSPSCLPVCEIERKFRFFAIFKWWITASASRSWRRGTRKRRRRWWRWIGSRRGIRSGVRVSGPSLIVVSQRTFTLQSVYTRHVS